MLFRTDTEKEKAVRKAIFSINPRNKQRPATTSKDQQPPHLPPQQQQQTPVHTTISSCWTTGLQLLGKRCLQNCDRICFDFYKNCNLKTDCCLVIKYKFKIEMLNHHKMNKLSFIYVHCNWCTVPTSFQSYPHHITFTSLFFLVLS